MVQGLTGGLLQLMAHTSLFWPWLASVPCSHHGNQQAAQELDTYGRRAVFRAWDLALAKLAIHQTYPPETFWGGVRLRAGRSGWPCIMLKYPVASCNSALKSLPCAAPTEAAPGFSTLEFIRSQPP